MTGFLKLGAGLGATRLVGYLVKLYGDIRDAGRSASSREGEALASSASSRAQTQSGAAPNRGSLCPHAVRVGALAPGAPECGCIRRQGLERGHPTLGCLAPEGEARAVGRGSPGNPGSRPQEPSPGPGLEGHGHREGPLLLPPLCPSTSPAVPVTHSWILSPHLPLFFLPLFGFRAASLPQT